MDYGIDLKVVKNFLCEGDKVGDYRVAQRGTCKPTLYYELPYPFPCKFAVFGLESIWVTPAMLKLPTFLKYHNIDWLRQQLMQVKCVENDAVLLHGAAWKKRGIGYLAVGFPNCGKTTRILQEMTTGPAVFCSDENVIVTKDRLILPVERHSSVNRWHIREFGLPYGFGVKNRLFWAEIRGWLCPLFEPNIWVKLPYKREAFLLDKIIYLTPGDSLALLTDNEFPFYTNPVLQAYAYATGWDLDGVYLKYRELLAEVESGGNDT